MTIGIYAGSFDPITNGHIDIIKRGLSLCDKVVIAIGVNSSKKTMFSQEERLDLINQVIQNEFESVYKATGKLSACSFDGLMINLAKEQGAAVLIRGIRSVSDFEYEINLANINKTLAPEIETVFLPTAPDMAVVSSSAAKEIAKFGGDITKFVPSYVADQIKKKFGFVKLSG